MTPTFKTVDDLLDWWPGNMPFKGSLVSDDGSCMCAQGQALHFLRGYSADDLRNMGQRKADIETMALFGISRAQAVLLRQVNDQVDGAPSIVIRNPAAIVGDQWPIIDAFWRHLDRMTAEQWVAAWDAAWDAAGDAARDAARDAAWVAAGDAAWDAAGVAAGDAARVAAWATAEIQGAAVMRAKGRAFFFLPAFGFADPEAVLNEAAA